MSYNSLADSINLNEYFKINSYFAQIIKFCFNPFFNKAFYLHARKK